MARINGHWLRWVFCIDFAEQVGRWEKGEILLLSVAARQIMWMLTPHGSGDTERGPGSGLMSRLATCLHSAHTIPIDSPRESGSLAIENDWAAIQLHTQNGKRGVITPVSFGKTPSVEFDWVPTDGIAGEYGVKYDRRTGKSCLIPLRYGPFVLGQLICGSQRGNYDTGGNSLYLDRILRNWQEFTEPSAEAPVPLDPAITPHDDPKHPGVMIWNEDQPVPPNLKSLIMAGKSKL